MSKHNWVLEVPNKPIPLSDWEIKELLKLDKVRIAINIDKTFWIHCNYCWDHLSETNANEDCIIPSPTASSSSVGGELDST